MSFLVYQRSDPRFKDWLLLVSQQIRLRNVIQIIGLNLDVENRDDEVYFTLHTRAMSTPFFTSERLQTKRRVVSWKEIEPRQFPESIRLSAPGFIIRVWVVSRAEPFSERQVDDNFRKVECENVVAKCNSPHQKTVISWGVHLGGLHYLGSKGDWNTKDFGPNTLLFRMPFGFFTSLDSLLRRPLSIHRYLQIQVSAEQIRSSYTLKKLSSLHSIQRSVLDEVSLGQALKSRISMYGYSQEIQPTETISQSFGEKSLMRAKEGRLRLELKEKIEGLRQRVAILRDEKIRRFGHVIQLKKDFYECEDISMDLMGRMQMLGRDMDRLKELKAVVQEKKVNLVRLSAQLFQRRRELISELFLIYPLSLVEGSRKYSINEIQLPNAEDYGTETGGQISVALGYTAHLTAMISFFLGIPLRYPLRHFGSHSRIVDHITEAITDKEREFPLYFRNKEDVYSRYAVYLLNKNIAQLRWFCGLCTTELRATLPNLYNLLNDRLTIPGWPPSPSDSLEVAQELTEEVDQQLFSSMSLDKGLDQLVPQEKGIENVWMRSSFSDLELVGGNNAVPSGEVKHGKTQDRFLNGWRKKTYESEEIDPRWLTNSLTLELDAGRRLSSASRLPILLVSDETRNVRKRRMGRVEQFPYIRRGSGSGSTKGKSPEPQQPPIVITTSAEPNDNLSHIENEITKFERRRSGNSSSPAQVLGSPVDENCLLSPTFGTDHNSEIFCGTENDISGSITSIPSSTSTLEFSIENEAPAAILEVKYAVADGEENSHDNKCYLDHIRLEPTYDPSSDERGGPDPPSPTFLRKLTVATAGVSEAMETPTFEASTLSDEGFNPMNLPVDDLPTFESSYRLLPPLGSDIVDKGNELLSSTESSACGSEATVRPRAEDEISKTENVDSDGAGGGALDESNSVGDDDDSFIRDFEQETLWLRTAAAFNPQSFVSKKRISEPN